MKNSTELRDTLLQLYTDLRNGSVDRKTAQELNNTVGKINAANKVELEYYSLRKSTPLIPFFEQPESK